MIPDVELQGKTSETSVIPPGSSDIKRKGLTIMATMDVLPISTGTHRYSFILAVVRALPCFARPPFQNSKTVVVACQDIYIVHAEVVGAWCCVFEGYVDRGRSPRLK